MKVTVSSKLFATDKRAGAPATDKRAAAAVGGFPVAPKPLRIHN